jgi:parallel beta-helix repeat protein
MAHRLIFCDFELSPLTLYWLRFAQKPLLCLTLLGLLQAPTLARRPTIPQQPAITAPEYIALSQVIYVNPVQGRDEGTESTQEMPFRTITYALQTAEAGTVIQLAPGTYSQEAGEVFPILIPKGVILKGDEANLGQNTMIFGGGNFVSPTFARQNATLRTGENSEIIGVTVTNPNTRGTGIWIEAASPSVSSSTFVNNSRDGIFITAGANPIITNNIFAQNQGNGLSVARSGAGTISNNLFQNTGFGISINDKATPEILENKIIENRDGVVVSHSAQPVLRNNLIENNTRDGVVAISQAQPDLGTSSNPGNNIIRNNARYDVYNATQGYTLNAIGNEIDPERISGAVQFAPSASRSLELNIPEARLSALSDIQPHWPPITRVQFAAVVQKAFLPASPQSVTPSFDLSQSFRGYNPVLTPSQVDFVSGYSDSTFRPGEALTRVTAMAGLTNNLDDNTENTNLLSIDQDINSRRINSLYLLSVR